jgi:hypothetical protein
MGGAQVRDGGRQLRRSLFRLRSFHNRDVDGFKARNMVDGSIGASRVNPAPHGTACGDLIQFVDTQFAGFVVHFLLLLLGRDHPLMHDETQRREKPFSSVHRPCDMAHSGELGHCWIQIRTRQLSTSVVVVSRRSRSDTMCLSETGPADGSLGRRIGKKHRKLRNFDRQAAQRRGNG